VVETAQTGLWLEFGNSISQTTTNESILQRPGDDEGQATAQSNLGGTLFP